MRTLHLFAGGAGGLYADLILGHVPVCAVELDPYACAVLRERAVDGWFPGLHVHEGDVRMFNPSPWAGRVDSVHAGFPCQDISTAGGGAGIHGERSGLYREVLRVADVVRPGYIFLENSPAIVGRGLGVVLGDLAARGYDARWTVLAADDVGAPHLRERWWCLAWRAGADGGRLVRQRESEHRDEQGARGCQPDGLRAGGRGDGPGRCSEVTAGPVPDTRHGDESERSWTPGRQAGERTPERRQLGSDGEAQCMAGPADRGGWWTTEPAVGRVAHGVAARRQRLHVLGNGQVPLCAAAAWRILGGPVSEGCE